MPHVRIIDRYVFFLFVRVFVICFLSLTGIYIVGDFVNNLTEFIEMSEQRGGMARAIASYYGVRAPWFFDFVGGVIALIASVFTITWLQRHNEMAALMAAGISRWRIIKPVFVGVIAISVFGIINRELILPGFKQQLSQKAQDIIGRSAKTVVPRFDQVTDILISGKRAIPAERRLDKPKFHLPLETAGFGRQIQAHHAIRMKANEQHPAGYLLKGVSRPSKPWEVDSFIQDGDPIIMTVKQYDWLQPNEIFVASDVSLGQLTGRHAGRQFASTKSLVQSIRNPSLDLGNSAHVAIHARMVKPILDMTLFFLGVPVVLAKESRNVFVAIGSCLLIVAVFFIIVMGFNSLGVNYIVSPELAAWLPIMALVPWAAFSAQPLFR